MFLNNKNKPSDRLCEGAIEILYKSASLQGKINPNFCCKKPIISLYN
jgi:hypothetical protein